MRTFYVPTYLHYNLLQQHQAASIRQRLIQNRHGKKASYHNKNANVHRKGRLSAAYQCQNNISRFKSLRHSSKKLIYPIGVYRKATLNISFVLRSHCIKKYPCVVQTHGFFRQYKLLVLALSGCFRLLLALYARLLIVLSLAKLGEDA